MSTMSEEHDSVMPYYYCTHCFRLSPTTGDLLDDLICLICGMSLDSDSAGRKVILSKDEALLRDLPWKVR